MPGKFLESMEKDGSFFGFWPLAAKNQRKNRLFPSNEKSGILIHPKYLSSTLSTGYPQAIVTSVEIFEGVRSC
jgi:hypothetical protein